MDTQEMTPREVVRRAVRFQNPPRLPKVLPQPHGSDVAYTGMNPNTDVRPRTGRDEWGALWDNVGVCNLGEVVEPALEDWADFDKLNVPDVREPRRWKDVPGARERAGDFFLMGGGLSLYERAHFVRGLRNLWMDIRLEPDNLEKILDILVDQNLYVIEQYAKEGVDGYLFCDDWGLQDKLMIDPEDWRRFWKPRYARVWGAAREAGMLTFLHSCGHIASILDDMIEIGLDCIQMDQQENMGLEKLGSRFAGRIAFWNPVDIQQTMAHGTLDEIRAYCRRMVRCLGRPEGGFMAKYYTDMKGAGHRAEAVEAMADEFMQISDAWYGPGKEWGV